MKTIFIITHQHGFEADPVIDTLRLDNIPVFRFNCDSGKNISQISFAINNNKTEIIFKCDGREIYSSDIGVCWCQQLPPYLNQASSVNENLQQRNLWAAQLAAFSSLNVSWLNNPCNIIHAANKPIQLMYARSIGLNIPNTLISNTPQHIRTFVKNQTTIAKNLGTPWIVSTKETLAAYTKIVVKKWLQNDKELEFSPIIYQEHVVRKKDYRVVVIGEDSFSASCEPNKHQKEDIRRNVSTGASFKPCKFDKKITESLHILMKKLSIEYCSADFMEDNNGNIYFLEINTCGAWWWVDRLYDGVICKTIAKYLKQR